MNVIASPAPTMIRPITASATAWAVASTNCPAPMVSAPTATRRRGPTRSSTTPTGICRPAYTASCITLNRLRTAAEV